VATNTRQVIDRIRAVYEADMAGLREALSDVGADDFVQEWPQSGERLRREAALKVAEGYADATGAQPSFSFRRLLDGGDWFVIEGTIDYGNGSIARYAGIFELRDGKLARLTEYFASPFEAPAWRADLVERM
jgi:ketosteroid isomerase-like protein